MFLHIVLLIVTTIGSLGLGFSLFDEYRQLWDKPVGEIPLKKLLGLVVFTLIEVGLIALAVSFALLTTRVIFMWYRTVT